MIDPLTISVIGTGISTGVAILALLRFLSDRATKKELTMDVYAKAQAVDGELDDIRNDIKDRVAAEHDHGSKISSLQSSVAVLNSQVETILRETNKLHESLEKIKDILME